MTDTQSARIACEILSLLRERGAGKTICPADVAQRLPLDQTTDEGWQDWMPSVSAVVSEMARAGMIVVSQRGEIVDPQTAAGPIYISIPEVEHRAR